MIKRLYETLLTGGFAHFYSAAMAGASSTARRALLPALIRDLGIAPESSVKQVCARATPFTTLKRKEVIVMKYDKPNVTELSSAISLIRGDKEDVIPSDFGTPDYHSLSAYQADE